MGLMSLIGLINIEGSLYHDEVRRLQSGRLLKWSLKSGILNVGFRITSRVQTRDASKLLFALTNDCREGMIAFLYPFDLFEGPLIMPISCNSFWHGGSKSLETIVNVDPESMRITVFSDTFPGIAVQHIEMFCLKLFKIHLNINPKFIVVDVCSCANIEPMCNPLIK